MFTSDFWIKIVNLLSDLIVYDSFDFEQFLKKLIKVILRIIPVDSCLIYFYDHEKKELILIASKKTHRHLLGHITLKRGEGITGWVVKHEQPVVLHEKAYLDERFKSFKELPEDKYEAFLSIPILNKSGAIGVINLQHKEAYNFSLEQVRALEVIVKIVASAFAKIVLEREIGRLETKLEERKAIEKAKGILMREKRLSEGEAFQLLRHEAMRKRKTIKEIADAVLLIYD